MMTQKSLVYMMLAIAVGYLLVSTVPQQVSMYTNPQRMTLTGSDSNLESAPKLGVDAVPEADGSLNDSGLEIQGTPDDLSFMELSKLPELMKWWALDIVLAITIYWIARRRLA